MAIKISNREKNQQKLCDHLYNKIPELLLDEEQAIRIEVESFESFLDLEEGFTEKFHLAEQTEIPTDVDLWDVEAFWEALDRLSEDEIVALPASVDSWFVFRCKNDVLNFNTSKEDPEKVVSGLFEKNGFNFYDKDDEYDEDDD